ncbi:MAG: type II secretion system minor pseudopilin GspI, partial [Stenotrophomonas koreensis]
MNRPLLAGFTLIEVLVALLVLGSVATMVYASVQRYQHNAVRMEQQLLAGWLADNTLAEMQLTGQVPVSDAQAQRVHYGGLDWWLLREADQDGNAADGIHP